MAEIRDTLSPLLGTIEGSELRITKQTSHVMILHFGPKEYIVRVEPSLLPSVLLQPVHSWQRQIV